MTAGLTSIGASDFIQALVTEGIIAGVGAVLVFVPQIFALFFFISLLEDSGYMARIAVVMDRIMEFFGLNGKAFIPMIIGFGCNVPCIMAARTIEQDKERLLTVLVTPFMSCSARLPVYALFAGVFFPHSQATVVFSLYVAGIVLALLVTKIMSLTILKAEKSIFVIELPPYRVPQAKTLWLSTWEKGKGFVRKAGTFIFGGSVVIWLLNYAGPSGFGVDMGDSYLAMIGGFIAPLFARSVLERGKLQRPFNRIFSEGSCRFYNGNYLCGERRCAWQCNGSTLYCVISLCIYVLYFIICSVFSDSSRY